MSKNIRKATPTAFVGAGVSGILSGFGIVAYFQTLYKMPKTKITIAK
jgi:hypothetical protein